uniref:(northern house mosquito) hypothetical protein n=1 Tax=Culex pipiens TaxID=7175 RepID=A0A8D8CCR7_CULPI
MKGYSKTIILVEFGIKVVPVRLLFLYLLWPIRLILSIISTLSLSPLLSLCLSAPSSTFSGTSPSSLPSMVAKLDQDVRIDPFVPGCVEFIDLRLRYLLHRHAVAGQQRNQTAHKFRRELILGQHQGITVRFDHCLHPRSVRATQQQCLCVPIHNVCLQRVEVVIVQEPLPGITQRTKPHRNRTHVFLHGHQAVKCRILGDRTHIAAEVFFAPQVSIEIDLGGLSCRSWVPFLNRRHVEIFRFHPSQPLCLLLQPLALR